MENITPDSSFQSISVPSYIFNKRVKSDYSEWRKALVREFVQNGEDAQSKRIEFTLDYHDRILTVGNNGDLMTIDTCLNSLLTLGGTDKGETDDTVGGYGIAKELLYFAWSRWGIKSGDYAVTGAGGTYKISEDVNPYHTGVLSVLDLTSEEQLSISSMLNSLTYVLSNCNTRAHLYLNGKRMPRRARGRIIQNEDWCTVEYKKRPRHKTSSVSILHKGVWMFDTWAGTEFPGEVTIHLKGNARAMMTSNRDCLTYDYRRKLSYLLDSLGNSLTSMTASSYNNRVVRRDGYLYLVAPRSKMHDLHLYEVSKEPKESTGDGCLVADPGTLSPPSGVYTPSGKHLPQVLCISEDSALPEKYKPENWTQNLEELIRIWSVILQQVQIDCGRYMQAYGVGMVISKSATAQHTTKDGASYFLLNPRKFKFPRSRAAMRKLIHRLRLIACHELSHGFGSHRHDEEFVRVFHDLVEKSTEDNIAYIRHAYNSYWTVS